MSYQLKVFFSLFAFTCAFFFCSISFYLVAIWKVPSEWLTAISVNFQCGSSADLLLSLLSFQQVPQEPRWTWAGVFRSSSWQEPRPCLLVVNEGRAHSPPRRLQPGGFCRELGQPPCGSPLPRPPRSLRFSQPQPPGSSGDMGPGEAAHTHVPQKLLPPPRACRCGVCLASRLRASGLSQPQRSGRPWPQLPPRASCTLCRSSWPRALFPEVTPAAPGPSHPGTLLLFALAVSLLCSEHSAPRLSLACSPRRTP